ncbi:23S rRNA (adenine(1618)-N(6))-methyltransferase RlmF [Tamlana fucoidanivorans]|uniref:Ribosomal RNA large subunit methyltransferase F n=1 Tax=Allotamlana fucoidanivorans TaxID=2583814 RepID=A0A5C4SG37_9FLAO|nr:23S rRNA (adenine(1618)-N(6))-methyltransferase RlmF [Tamlana fucoidanivorans]
MNLHRNNKHKNGYNLKALSSEYLPLKPFVFENAYGNLSIDFSNPKAVKALNTALLFKDYNIRYWDFPDDNLCPPIPGRADYIHHLADFLKTKGITKGIRVLDVGTGASCIYPLLGQAEYQWTFVATDVDNMSLKWAQRIVAKNHLKDTIELRHQPEVDCILKHIVNTNELFTSSMCNPPFYKSEQEALEATQRKLKGLGKNSEEFTRNFSGKHNELWYKGGEKAFIHNYLFESMLHSKQFKWFTTLVSKKDLVRGIRVSLKKLGATEVNVINMGQGNKVSRFVAWTFN